ncbi:superinfection immunity protein [Parendozoicomonas haliclonae]|uniref:Superinfection immunity protein n=1 Tax=Parendozoicomonas haliclonae TaxID=1960125 RepID=A0A1X7AEK5_9GAMM|nr:superinfection immunity protein [Parendozoicomonas haliclonae]SMA34786.1 hypothetical protein EHSB41UT_00450 [Parendozoicomonas haliclonae]
MDFDITNLINEYMTELESMPLPVLLIIIAVSIVFVFIPSLLALLFNRRHFKLILAANIPAAFSTVAWFGLIVWAVTGKVWERKPKQAAPES